MVRAALFDMDRTLVRKETASLYVKYQRAMGEATLVDTLRVFYWVLQYTAGIIDAPEVATRALRPFMGIREEDLSARCDHWFPRYVEPHVCERGREAVAAHRARGEVVAIVTGASVYATRPLGRLLEVEHLVTSELEVDEGGRMTGRFVEPLCFGVGKIVRAERLAAKLGFTLGDATFYSDSFTDLPLLERVREPVCVNPDFRLRRIARQRGWRIERW